MAGSFVRVFTARVWPTPRARKAIFLEALETVWSELEAKDRPSEYFKGGPDGIDLVYYDDSFCKKLTADYRLAQDGDFYARYVNGYEFPAMPRFRQDTPAWEGFVRSWCESVLLEASKGAIRSLMTRTVFAIIEDAGVDPAIDPKGIREWLNKPWDKEIGASDNRTVGEQIMAYHVDG